MKTLQEIIQELKATALESGFIKVEEKIINQNDVSDTELPIMFITLDGFEYPQFSIDIAEELYTFNLFIVIAKDVNPISALKTLQDAFVSKLISRKKLEDYFLHNKIILVSTNISNDKELKKELGGESCVLKLTISNKLVY